MSFLKRRKWGLSFDQSQCRAFFSLNFPSTLSTYLNVCSSALHEKIFGHNAHTNRASHRNAIENARVNLKHFLSSIHCIHQPKTTNFLPFDVWNPLEQTEQINRLTSECVRLCCCKILADVKLRPQAVHKCCRMPVWMDMCVLSDDFL